MYELYLQKILTEIRGNKSQTQLSRELGYAFNQYYKYESGSKKIFLDEFFKLCEIQNIKLLSLINQTLMIEASKDTQMHIIERFCHRWVSDDESVVCDRLAISDSTWWRIKKGRARISMHDFLVLIHAFSDRMFLFIEGFFKSKEKVLFIHDEIQASHPEHVYKRYPEASFISTAIYLQEYINSVPNKHLSVLSDLTKIELERINKIVDLMLKNKILVLKDGKLKASRIKYDFIGRDNEAKAAIQSYILEGLHKNSESIDHINFRVGPVSEDAFEKIKEELKKCSVSISQIIANDPADKRTKLVCYTQTLNQHTD